MRARIVRVPSDARAAVVLADALLRAGARLRRRGPGGGGGARPVGRAEAVSRSTTRRGGCSPPSYLSEHRFAEAVREGERLRTQSPRDPWNYGVIGDGRLELGDYEDAFAAFQQMLDLRPSASAYARASYTFTNCAATSRRRSTRCGWRRDATSPRDPESLAWHHAQIASLLFQMGRAKEAQTEYARALAFWPGHPAAVIGLGRLKAFAGDYAGALALYEEEFTHAPTPDLSAQIGDVYAALGNRAGAERHYALAEAGWRSDAPEPEEPGALPGRPRSIAGSGRHHRRAAPRASRHDIFTEDALAWAYFRAGRLAEASSRVDAVAPHRHVRSHAPLSRGGDPLSVGGRRGSADTRRPLARREPALRSRECVRRSCVAPVRSRPMRLGNQLRERSPGSACVAARR